MKGCCIVGWRVAQRRSGGRRTARGTHVKCRKKPGELPGQVAAGAAGGAARWDFTGSHGGPRRCPLCCILQCLTAATSGPDNRWWPDCRTDNCSRAVPHSLPATLLPSNTQYCRNRLAILQQGLNTAVVEAAAVFIQ